MGDQAGSPRSPAPGVRRNWRGGSALVPGRRSDRKRGTLWPIPSIARTASIERRSARACGHGQRSRCLRAAAGRRSRRACKKSLPRGVPIEEPGQREAPHPWPSRGGPRGWPAPALRLRRPSNSFAQAAHLAGRLGRDGVPVGFSGRLRPNRRAGHRHRGPMLPHSSPLSPLPPKRAQTCVGSPIQSEAPPSPQLSSEGHRRQSQPTSRLPAAASTFRA
jgi:hypothetical protein